MLSYRSREARVAYVAVAVADNAQDHDDDHVNDHVERGLAAARVTNFWGGGVPSKPKAERPAAHREPRGVQSLPRTSCAARGTGYGQVRKLMGIDAGVSSVTKP